MPHPPDPRSAYLHIPFCHRRCFYCDFAVVPLGDRVDEGCPAAAPSRTTCCFIARSLPLQAIRRYDGLHRRWNSFLLTAAQITALLAALRQRLGLQQGAEITLEMDPASFDQQQLMAVLAAGVELHQPGGPEFDDAVLMDLGRRHLRADLLEACHWMQTAHRNGELRSWSLDLIQNLPGQTFDHWDDQLDQALATQAPHLSVYDLSVEPGTVFARRAERAQLDPPEEDLAVRLMAHTSTRLAAAGLSRYEISNHARPGHASRHNRVYWSGAGWWGFGMVPRRLCGGNAWRALVPGRPIAAGWRRHSRLRPGKGCLWTTSARGIAASGGCCLTCT